MIIMTMIILTIIYSTTTTTANNTNNENDAHNNNSNNNNNYNDNDRSPQVRSRRSLPCRRSERATSWALGGSANVGVYTLYI